MQPQKKEITGAMSHLGCHIAISTWNGNKADILSDMIEADINDIVEKSFVEYFKRLVP